jgi:hypothetical protein
MAYIIFMSFTGFFLLVLLMAIGTEICQFQAEALAKRPEDESAGIPASAKEFRGAKESLLKKDLKASAEEIRKGIASLESIEAKAEKSREKAYRKSIHNMRELADRVENRTVASVTQLDQEFARAYYAIANYHYLKAAESWTKKEALAVRQDLKAAGVYLEGGVNHVLGEIENGVRTVSENTRFLLI